MTAEILVFSKDHVNREFEFFFETFISLQKRGKRDGLKMREGGTAEKIKEEGELT